MKFNRRDFLIATSAAGLLTQSGQISFAAEKNSNDEKKFVVEDKKVTVYMTAEKGG